MSPYEHKMVIYFRLYAYYTKQHINDNQKDPFLWNRILKVFGNMVDTYVDRYNTHARFLQLNKLRLIMMRSLLEPIL